MEYKKKIIISIEREVDSPIFLKFDQHLKKINDTLIEHFSESRIKKGIRDYYLKQIFSVHTHYCKVVRSNRDIIIYENLEVYIYSINDNPFIVFHIGNERRLKYLFFNFRLNAASFLDFPYTTIIDCTDTYGNCQINSMGKGIDDLTFILTNLNFSGEIFLNILTMFRTRRMIMLEVSKRTFDFIENLIISDKLKRFSIYLNSPYVSTNGNDRHIVLLKYLKCK